MRPLYTLAASLLFGACENPVEHFTEPPPRPGHHYTVPACPVDTLPDGEPLPPGYVDSTGCRR